MSLSPNCEYPVDTCTINPMYALPKTNSPHLKIDGLPKRKRSSSNHQMFQVQTVCFKEGILDCSPLPSFLSQVSSDRKPPGLPLLLVRATPRCYHSNPLEHTPQNPSKIEIVWKNFTFKTKQVVEGRKLLTC